MGVLAKTKLHETEKKKTTTPKNFERLKLKVISKVFKY